ncbi:MAG: GNAT family N-acetyltransferase [Candidatus Pacebacteria bacterium]|nr:GNAT family N-acetyltransferase [Candidatus Paceibacterota bacterium]
MNIKKIEKGDFLQFFKLLEEANDTQFDIHHRQRLLGAFEKCTYSVFGYFDKDELIALIVTLDSFSTTQAKRTLYVEEFYVVPSERGRGVGKTLFDWVIEYAKVEKYCRIEWRTSRDNADAQKFYSKYSADTEWKYYVLNID